MVKKPYAVAIGLFLAIAVATLLGAAVVNFIDPEFARGHADYERNFRLLAHAKSFLFFATLLLNVVLWFAACIFLIKSKGRSNWWLLLAILGPFGFAFLAMLGDVAPEHRDLYQRFVRNLNIYVRAGYETFTLLLVWTLAFQIIEWKHALMVAYESATTGLSTAQILQVQNASSGMWAFGEGLQTMYLVVLIYLLWPVCFNIVGRLLKSPASPVNSAR